MPLSGDLDEGGLIFGFTTRGYYKARKLLDPTAGSDGAWHRPRRTGLKTHFSPSPIGVGQRVPIREELPISKPTVL
jgi:hypothetical protein